MSDGVVFVSISFTVLFIGREEDFSCACSHPHLFSCLLSSSLLLPSLFYLNLSLPYLFPKENSSEQEEKERGMVDSLV